MPAAAHMRAATNYLEMGVKNSISSLAVARAQSLRILIRPRWLAMRTLPMNWAVAASQE
ncbi:hypothetical protein GA0061101_11932 [Rhizobium lusitanum]|uniref:Uncharacterized protein n=1 Tax=Rhizobium lusitanum TaxID=293958 RepID=A0A1C3WXS3_9HYPH|nr:hypothetical protein [Ensifer adhaerens]SCB44524.1 hypothetical protein GA0061101_11932 [Rhizobium lusitanum]